MPFKTDHIQLFSGGAVGCSTKVVPSFQRFKNRLVRNDEARNITEFGSLA